MPDLALQLDAMINDLREGLQVEVKNWLNGLSEPADKARLAKEIIALANSGGGFIFIGFEDQEPHGPIAPREGEARGFNQDAIGGIVNAYLTPPCQCELHLVRQSQGNILHPVIVVPGEHRTPVFAARGGPLNDILDNGKVYVRRPGGNSEHARTQDDWERLLDRMVRARQDDQLNAIRAILNPADQYLAPAEPDAALSEWIAESLARWNARLANLAADDLRRFPNGYWYVAYRISNFIEPTLIQLSEQLDRQMPKYSGWPPFTFLHGEDRRPQPVGNSIEAWLGSNNSWEHSDFWRVSRNGYAFLVRPMQEDRDGYGQNVQPPPPRPTFDWVLPIYRMTEVLRQAEALATLNQSGESHLELQLCYAGTEGRTLWRVDGQFWLDEQGPCRINEISNRISANIAELQHNLNETVWRLLQPVYEQFNFAELSRGLVDRVVADAHDFRARLGR